MTARSSHEMQAAQVPGRRSCLSILLSCLAGFELGFSLAAAPLADLEQSLVASPVLYDSLGRKLADAAFAQSIEDGHLRVVIAYDFGGGRRIEERAGFLQQPDLVQEDWRWAETRNGETIRRFTVDFAKGKAVAEKVQGRETKRWATDVKIEPGRTFAGFGFTLALKSLREPLMKGQKVEVRAVGFIPSPHLVGVELSFVQRDSVSMAGRMIEADRFAIHPKIPWLARSFVSMEDTRIWLAALGPPGFLRWEGPLLEPGDPVIRVDLLSSGRDAADGTASGR